MATRQENDATALLEEESQPDLLTAKIESALAHPERSSGFDFHAGVDDVLKDVAMSTADSGGELTFYGQDPILPSPHRFGTMAALGLAARSIAVAALWRDRTGDGQDIAVDVRKALQRFAGFFELKWETINGRPPAFFEPLNPFIDLPLFRETRDGRHVIALNIYPRLAVRGLALLRCGNSPESVRNAILQWRAEDLENAGAEAGLPIAMVRTFEEFRKEPQYTEVLSGLPLISVEKIGESEPPDADAGDASDGTKAVRRIDVRAGHATSRRSGVRRRCRRARRDRPRGTAKSRRGSKRMIVLHDHDRAVSDLTWRGLQRYGLRSYFRSPSAALRMR